MPSSPLEGLKVLDLTEGIAGPYCTKLLGDFGAEITKVERPHVGDWTRHRGPFYQDQPDPEHSLLFAYLNTNKRSVTLNLDSSFGQQTVRSLAGTSDILVESHPAGYLKNLGLVPESLREDNPRLVITSIPPFKGQGTFADYKATELNLYAMSGLMSIVGGAGKSPLKAGGYQAQYMAGLQACVYTLFAAYQARASGEGHHIDTSVVEVCTKILEHVSDYTIEEEMHRRPDEKREHGNYVLPCRDGYVAVTIYYFQMQTLAELLGNPSIATDPRFVAENGLRDNRDALQAELAKWLHSKTADEAQEEGQKRHMLFNKVNSTRDLVASPHFNARDFFAEIDHPAIGRAKYPGPPFRLAGSPAVPPKPAPTLGEANEMILCRRLGYSREDLVRLRATGAI